MFLVIFLEIDIKRSFIIVNKLARDSVLNKFKFNKKLGFFLTLKYLQKVLLPSINLIIVFNLKPKK